MLTATKIQTAALLLLSAAFAGAGMRSLTAPCEILIPVLDARKTPVTATAPDGRSYPVFRPAQNIRHAHVNAAVGPRHKA